MLWAYKGQEEGRSRDLPCHRHDRSQLEMMGAGAAARHWEHQWKANRARLISLSGWRCGRRRPRALGVSERTLRVMLPRLPHFRVGSAVLIPVDALPRWLNEQARAEQDRSDRIVAEVLASLQAGAKPRKPERRRPSRKSEANRRS